MKVAIAGSRRLPKGHAPRLLIRFLAALPEDAVILLRRGMKAEYPSLFEGDISELADILHLDVEWFIPAPTDITRGRSSVYVRDIDMIEKADLVVLFFAADEVAEGYGGTQHLLDKALAANRPVYAYSVDEYGTIERVGDYDPDELYASLAPEVRL
jgi:nucleoside 2-deoxyribosyltransferase